MGSGIFSEKSNEEYSKKFAEFFESKLDIKADRGYITFWDPCKYARIVFSHRCAHTACVS